MPNEPSVQDLTADALKLQEQWNSMASALTSQRDAILAAHLSNALRSIALAIKQVADGESAAPYLGEIIEQSDVLWQLGEEWAKPNGE